MQAIRRRHSCRTCRKEPLAPELRGAIEQAIARQTQGPFGTKARFLLLAATEQDTGALKQYGTYGFVRNPAAFIVGAIQEGAKNLEDFGYLMEHNILQATLLGAGTCWLGGTFTRSRFAALLDAGDGVMPAVVSVGYIPEKPGLFDRIVRWNTTGDNRLPSEQLFFDGNMGTPLTRQRAGSHAEVLDMVRLAPSASNRQPWRIVRVGDRWDFHMRRTPGYRERNRVLFGVQDLQRADMGIAMCHFELSCKELGLGGRWVEQPADAEPPDGEQSYVVSWRT
jgi:nitroreductase